MNRATLFHPLTILLTAGCATLIFVALMLPLPRFAGEGRFYLWAYHAPIGFAFVVYLFDRAEHWRKLGRWQWALEPLVVALALARTVWPIPFISGHAVFLIYAGLTAHAPLLRGVAGLVFLDVIAVKVMLNDTTLIGGALVGGLAAGVTRLLKPRGVGMTHG